ncbi:response regulator [Desulforhabdus amnigena]|uniref:Stage 0 sporulation protein A homolog n=1 Tax=Desulforhabdus amnigena TaxID=40218 RepID=A0A9W6CW41_9BACT|nr:response regulator [Desulforhabdus amnigena]NLJ28974.1 response regulator [Deltaproteobacteria bacterium]GLI33629.1 hypothetical protein DAMNIGENAA_10620 [Desulforhabdus amnigena]
MNSSVTHILVVDDEEKYRKMLQLMLEKIGYKCELAANASEALDKIRNTEFDMVISDIRMPGKDGIELMREALKISPDLKFIIITGHAADYSYSDIIAGGATDFISKPFEMGKLKAKIERIERERNILQQLQQANEKLSEETRVSTLFAELSRQLISSDSIDETGRLVLDYAKRLTESSIGYTGYIDQKTGYLMTPSMSEEAYKGCRAGEKDSNILKHFKKSSECVLQEGKTILVNTPHEAPHATGVSSEDFSTHRFLSAPAMLNGRLLGQVAVADSRRDYEERDLAMIERLAALYALAIQRISLEKELKKTTEYLEDVFDNSVAAIGIVDRHGRSVKWNKSATALFGYTLDELKEKRVFELYPDKDALEVMLTRLRQEGHVSRYEIDLKRKDGTIAPFEVSISLLKDESNITTGSLCVAMDLSDLKRAMNEIRTANVLLEKEISMRKQIEEELREARDQLEKLLEERTAKLFMAGDILKRSIGRIRDITEG